VLVEHVEPEVRDRHADRAQLQVLEVGSADAAVGHVDGGLGDAVHVDELRAIVAVAGDPRFEQVHVQPLAAEDDLTQAVPRGPLLPGVGGHQVPEGGGRLVQHGDSLVEQQAAQRLRRPGHLGRDDHQPAAVQQRAPDLPHREVEADGVEERPDVVVAEAEPVLGPLEEPHDVAVLDQHPLGIAGRA
jgi:hypothetical protein